MEAIAVIDFGSQYAHLIANRIRRLGIYAEILLPEVNLEALKKYKGIILSGGPQSVYGHSAPTIDRRVFSLGIPILGICYGHQLITHLMGGKILPGETKEYGIAQFSVLKKTGILKNVRSHTKVWMSHGDSIERLSPQFEALGKTDDCRFAATRHRRRKIFSTQFHLEATHTQEGMKMLKNFLSICMVKRQWNTESFLKQKIGGIKKILGDRKVFLLVSGGVDSTVAFTFLSKILGSRRVYGLLVDTGLLPKNEVNRTRRLFKKIHLRNFHIVHAKQRFFKALEHIIHPEDKRKIIGDLFLKVQAQAVRRLRLNPAEWLLGQGTIYPDTVESAGTKYADKIKTHHNRVPQIEKLMRGGKLIEPLKDLYKDEVRLLGKRFGLPDDLIWKHPFPGPGLAVRILCAEREHFPQNISSIEEKIAYYLQPYGLFSKILPLQSVGVQGDARTYRHPLLVWGKVHTFDELEKISTSLTNRFSQINRVCLLLEPSTLKTVRLLSSFLTEKRVRFLQELYDKVMKFIKKHGLNRAIWQFPIVLLPLSINGVKREVVVLRPICSEEAMTASFYKMKWPLLHVLMRILRPTVSGIFYDITNKPPGTIEWE